VRRVSGLIGLLTLVVILSGCAAGAPPVVPSATSNAPQLAAVQATLPPTAPPEAAMPTPIATSAPIATTAPAEPAEPAAPTVDMAPDFQETDTPADAPDDADLAADDGAAAESDPAPEADDAEFTSRPPPPPAPEDGLSIVVPDPGTLEHPLLNGGPNPKEIALTFDAGADPGYAADILDLLGDEGITASFGMTGQWAEANPDLVRRIVEEGHMLFNHTWDHGSLTGANTGQPAQTAEQVAEQLSDTEAVVMELTGYDMKPYFRPPYGDYDDTSLRYLADNGYYITVWWTCDTRGWDGWDAAKITGYCTTNIKDHEIILLHVGAGAPGDYESLPGMIEFFRNEGYAFVSVEEMLQP